MSKKINDLNKLGFVQVKRSLLRSKVFSNPDLLRIYLWCHFKATFKRKAISLNIGRGNTEVTLQRGEFVTGRYSGAEELNINPSTFWSWLKKLEKLGYDMKMILVNTDLETAIKRDAQRSRSLGKKKVTEYWKTVQKNIGALQTVFGRKNFMVVDNTEGKDYQKETLRAYKDIRKFVNKAPDNKIAKDWIKREKEKRGITR